MEDVEQQRQRLAAMREQAAQQTDISPNPMTPTLTFGPFDSSPPVPPRAEVSSSGSGFYTDPLAGFTGSKRKKSDRPGVLSTPSTAPVLPEVLPTFSNTRSCNVAPLLHSGNNAPPAHQARIWQPTPYQLPDPVFPAPPYPNCSNQFYPQPPPHTLSQNYNHGFSQGSGSRVPSYSVPGSFNGNAGGGRSYLPSRPGGGRGYDNRAAMSLGRKSLDEGTSSRGREVHGRSSGGPTSASAKEQPHLYFKMSMLEDPWRHLEAI